MPEGLSQTSDTEFCKNYNDFSDGNDLLPIDAPEAHGYEKVGFNSDFSEYEVQGDEAMQGADSIIHKMLIENNAIHGGFVKCFVFSDFMPDFVNMSLQKGDKIQISHGANGEFELSIGEEYTYALNTNTNQMYAVNHPRNKQRNTNELIANAN